jgi:L,D-transpeptidase catalytic domain
VSLHLSQFVSRAKGDENPGNLARKLPSIPELNASTVNSFSSLRFPLAATLMFIMAQNFLDAQGAEARPHVEIMISVAEQRLALVEDGVVVRKFPVSTSKFGLGDNFGSYKTPLGRLRVCGKLGEDLPEGAVFKHRKFSGEVLPVNARGRDPIVTRILWLEGAEPCNQNARNRCIYIHGTPQERSIGKAISYGCVRMRSRDVVQVFHIVPVGTPVTIINKKLPRIQKPQQFKVVSLRTIEAAELATIAVIAA